MADNFGLKIGLEGEKEFKAALRDINQSFKILGSEMNLVTSQFGKNNDSIEGLAAKNRVLNKEIEAQTEKIKTLEAALENASTSFGETDKRTQNWQIQLNNAQADLNKLNNEVQTNSNKIDEQAKALDKSGDSASDLSLDLSGLKGDVDKTGNEFDDAKTQADKFGDEVEDTADQAEKSGSRFEKLGGILKGIGVAFGAATVAAGAASIKLGKEVVQQFGELEQNLGGSEAVFGEYAASIQKTGEEAYKTWASHKANTSPQQTKWVPSSKGLVFNNKELRANRKGHATSCRYGVRHGY